MRISDGINKYHEDTKNRIFENIMASAASEEAQGYSSPTDKREIGSGNITSTAANSKAVVKRDWTGLIAIAACAVLAVGVGTVMTKGMSPQPGYVNGTAADETESSDGAVTQAVTAQVSGPDEKRDPDPYYENGMTFGDLLEQSDEVVELSIQECKLVKIKSDQGNVRSAKEKYYAEYTAVYEYDIDRSGMIFKSGGSGAAKMSGTTKYFQYLGEADDEMDTNLLTANIGDKVLVFVKNRASEGEPGIDSGRLLTTGDSIFKFNIANHRYENIASPGKYEDEVNGFVHDAMLNVTPAAVGRWAAYHRMSLVTVEETNDTVPSGHIIDLEWDESRCAYVMTVSR